MCFQNEKCRKAKKRERRSLWGMFGFLGHYGRYGRYGRYSPRCWNVHDTRRIKCCEYICEKIDRPTTPIVETEENTESLLEVLLGRLWIFGQ